MVLLVIKQTVLAYFQRVEIAVLNILNSVKQCHNIRKPAHCPGTSHFCLLRPLWNVLNLLIKYFSLSLL